MQKRKQVRYRALADLSLKEDRNVVWYKGDFIDESLLTPDRLQGLVDRGHAEVVTIETAASPAPVTEGKP